MVSSKDQDSKAKAEAGRRSDVFSSMFQHGRSFSGRERHCVYLNTGDPQFANVSAASGLDFADDGRAVALVDWDQDGDLDLWIANRTAPRLRFMRNDVGATGSFVAIRVQGDGKTTNRDAIGARVEVVTKESGDKKRIKTLRAGEGFLAQSSKWLHFGLGSDKTIESVSVTWPNGVAEQFTGLVAGKRYSLVQGSGKSVASTKAPRAVSLRPSTPKVPKVRDTGRTPLVSLLPIAPLNFKDGDKVITTGNGKPTLVVLWASWCPPCISELHELTERFDEIEASGLSVVALCVNGVGADRTSLEKAASVIRKFKSPLLFGRANNAFVQYLQLLNDSVFMIKRPLPVPSSFLIDGAGRLSVIYKGRVSVDQVLADLTHSSGSATERLQRAAFLPGRLMESAYLDSVRRRREVMIRFPVAVGLNKLKRHREAMDQLLEILEIDPEYADAHFAVGNLESLRPNGDRMAAERYRRAIELKPDMVEAHYNLAIIYAKQGKNKKARAGFLRTLELRPEFVGTFANLGKLDQAEGRFADAEKNFRRVLARSWDAECANNIAWLLATRADASDAERAEALTLAKRLAADTKFGNPGVLDTLAAAHAQNGEFEEAVRWEAKAVELTKGKVPKLKTRLEQYRQGKPQRQ